MSIVLACIPPDEEPNKMLVRANGQPHRIYSRDPNAGYLSATAKAVTGSHCNGFLFFGLPGRGAQP